MTEDALESLVVLQLAANADRETVLYLLARARAPRDEGGAELQANLLEDGLQQSALTIHLSANVDRLLRGAERIALKKEDLDGTMQHFTVDAFASFKGSDNKNFFLTVSEKQRIILHELESMCAESNEEPVLFGRPLYIGEGIVTRLRNDGIIVELFPLHSKVELSELACKWPTLKMNLTDQPLDAIRRYFGETIGMYFAFLSCYTNHLILTAALGLLCTFFGSEVLNPLFCVFNMVWSTVFLERWKRMSSTHAHRWGTFGSMDMREEPRAAYHGDVVKNEVTGRKELRYSTTWHWLKFCCVSVPIMLVSLLVSVLVALAYFAFCSYLEPVEKNYELSTITFFLVRQSPNVLYALVILIMNEVYRRIAYSLNDWENHRLQSSYENHLITKLVLFAFTNYFTPLLYVAFYLQDLQLLRNHLAILMVTHMVVQQLLEAVWPYCTYKRRKVTVIARQLSENKGSNCAVSDEVRHQAEIQSTKEQYSRPLDDYLELFVQFGYVFLFSSVFPIAAFLALVNNLVEIRTDAFKLCRVYRRPFSQPTDGIGVWQVAFEMLSVIAVKTNCALVALSPPVRAWTASYQPVHVLLAFVFIEHLLLFTKAALSYLIPDVPKKVRQAIAKEEHLSKQRSVKGSKAD